MTQSRSPEIRGSASGQRESRSLSTPLNCSFFPEIFSHPLASIRVLRSRQSRVSIEPCRVFVLKPAFFCCDLSPQGRTTPLATAVLNAFAFYSTRTPIDRINNPSAVVFRQSTHSRKVRRHHRFSALLHHPSHRFYIPTTPRLFVTPLNSRHHDIIIH